MLTFYSFPGAHWTPHPLDERHRERVRNGALEDVQDQGYGNEHDHARYGRSNSSRKPKRAGTGSRAGSNWNSSAKGRVFKDGELVTKESAA